MKRTEIFSTGERTHRVFRGKTLPKNAILTIILTAVLVILAVPTAKAQEINCTFTMSNISFGSIDVSTGKPYEATGSFTYACTGDSREMIRICPSWDIGDVGKLDDGAGHKLLFNLYSDEGHATVWSSWFGKMKAPTIDVPIGRSERATGGATVYAQVPGGQQSVPAGTYKATIGGGHVSIDYDSCEPWIMRRDQALAKNIPGVVYRQRKREQCQWHSRNQLGRRHKRVTNLTDKARDEDGRGYSAVGTRKTVV